MLLSTVKQASQYSLIQWEQQQEQPPPPNSNNQVRTGNKNMTEAANSCGQLVSHGFAASVSHWSYAHTVPSG